MAPRSSSLFGVDEPRQNAVTMLQTTAMPLAAIRRTAALLALLTLFAAAGRIVSGAEISDEAKRLVRSLNARDLGEREAAEKSLVELGPGVLPLLPQVSDRTPAEVADRLRRVRQALLMRQVEASAQASVITLHATKTPLAEVLAALGKQSGNSVVDHREDFGEHPNAVNLSLDIDKQPFWQAFDKVLDEAGLSVYNYGSARSIYVINRPKGQSPRSLLASYSGPFRVAPTRFEAEIDLQKPDNRSLKLFLDVSWEPRLRPITLVQPLSTIHATSAEGELVLDSSDAEPETSVSGDHTSVELQIPLVLPPRGVSKITTLKGRMKALVSGPAEEFRFTELPLVKGAGEPKRVEQRKAAVTVTIDRVRKNNGAWEVDLRAKFDEPGDSLESHRGWIFENEAFFDDPKGNHITPASYEQTREARDEVGVKFLFEATESLAGWTFVYKTPLAILELPVEYELHDLQLP
jgi:hypothetical protein